MDPMQTIPLPSLDPDLPLNLVLTRDVLGEPTATLFASEVPVRHYPSPALSPHPEPVDLSPAITPSSRPHDHGYRSRFRDAYAYLLLALGDSTFDENQAFLAHLGTPDGDPRGPSESDAFDALLALASTRGYAGLTQLDDRILAVIRAFDVGWHAASGLPPGSSHGAALAFDDDPRSQPKDSLR